ncbi:MAG: PD-(D/E)XK nuclease family protein [Thermoanaerobaculia bacterium]
MGASPRHTLYTGGFAALEARFLEELRALKAGDALRPVDVLVGSNLLGVYLRRRAAETLGGVANLRLLTFVDLARERVPTPDPRPPLPSVGEALLARRALLETPEGAEFRELRGRPSTSALVARTAADLRGAGIAAGSLRELLPAVARSSDRTRFLASVAAVLARYEELRSAFADADALLARAAEADAPPRPDPLLVYGLYDLGGVREALLAAVAAERPVVAFVPVDGEAEVGDGATEAVVPLVRAALFGRLLGVPPRHAGPAPAPPEVSVVVAPSELSEAREVVREVLRAVDDGVPLHRIAVLVRDPARQEPALVAELGARELPFFRPAGTGFSRSPLGRAALGLLALPAGDFASDDLVALVDVLEGLALLPPGVRARVARALLEIRARGGWTELVPRIEERLARRPPEEAAEAEGRVTRREMRVRQDLAALREAVALLTPVLPDATPASWKVWSERLAASFDAIFGRLPGADELSGAAARLGELEAVEPGVRVAASDVLPLLAAALEETPLRQGRFERDGLSLLSSVSARGLLFDVVLVPGLVEQSFPRAGRPDPLLFDDERAALSRATRRPIAPRTGPRHVREERFLFHLARSAARRRLVLLAARREAATDRPRLLAPVLLAHLEERAGRSLSEAELATPEVGAALSLRWIRLGAPPVAEPPLDADEALRRALARAPRLRSALPPGLETLGRALRRGRARAEARYTEYEGRLARAPLRLGLGSRVLSPSRLERLAACAYRAFLQDALGLSAPEEAPAALAFDGRTTGELAHAALEAAAKSALERGIPLGDLLLSRADALAERTVTRFLADWEIDLPPVLAEVATEQLAAFLRAVGELERTRPDPLPLAGGEVAFGPGKGAEPAAGEDPLRVPLTGRIDRLDRSGEAARVVDYKFSKPDPFGAKNRKGYRIVGGEKVQLAAYALAARALGAESVSSEYLFVTADRKGAEPSALSVAFDAVETGEAVASFHRAVGLLDATIRKGDLLPRTASLSSRGSPCSFCDVAAVCGPGHARVYEAKRKAERLADPAAPLFALEEIP